MAVSLVAVFSLPTPLHVFPYSRVSVQEPHTSIVFIVLLIILFKVLINIFTHFCKKFHLCSMDKLFICWRYWICNFN